MYYPCFMQIEINVKIHQISILPTTKNLTMSYMRWILVSLLKYKRILRSWLKHVNSLILQRPNNRNKILDKNVRNEIDISIYLVGCKEYCTNFRINKFYFIFYYLYLNVLSSYIVSARTQKVSYNYEIFICFLSENNI